MCEAESVQFPLTVEMFRSVGCRRSAAAVRTQTNKLFFKNGDVVISVGSKRGGDHVFGRERARGRSWFEPENLQMNSIPDVFIIQ